MKPPLSGESVAARLAALGIGLEADAAAKLARFLDLLERWNRVHNLTGIADRDRLIDRHLAESLALAPFLCERAGSARGVADIGSGGGLPGVPLAILRPETPFTLIESRRKRVSFLRQVVVTLELGNVTIAHGRAESLDLPDFATVVARAVAPPAELIALVRALLAPGGRFLLLTGAERARELLALADGFVPAPVTSPIEGLASAIVVLERELS